MEMGTTYGVLPVVARLTGKPPELSMFRPMVGNLELMLLTLVPMWLLAAFDEECPPARGGPPAGFFNDPKNSPCESRTGRDI